MEKTNDKKEESKAKQETGLFSRLKFKRNIELEKEACNAIASFVQEKEQLVNINSNILMSIILEQLMASSNLFVLTKETELELEEHNIIKHTNDYLSKVKNSIESSKNPILKKNTLSECIDCLDRIAKDTSNTPYGEQIKERMRFFIDCLREKK